jgi:rhodanese-related sulfurtransferase
MDNSHQLGFSKGKSHPKILIDVRTPLEFSSSNPPPLPGAVNIEYQLLPNSLLFHLPETTTSDDIVLYCRSGRRSAIAKDALGDSGYINVTDWGGLDSAWMKWNEIKRDRRNDGNNNLEASNERKGRRELEASWRSLIKGLRED